MKKNLDPHGLYGSHGRSTQHAGEAAVALDRRAGEHEAILSGSPVDWSRARFVVVAGVIWRRPQQVPTPSSFLPEAVARQTPLLLAPAKAI